MTNKKKEKEDKLGQKNKDKKDIHAKIRNNLIENTYIALQIIVPTLKKTVLSSSPSLLS